MAVTDQELTPIEHAARSAFERAIARGAPANVRWSKARRAWVVPSSRAGEGPWEVKRVRPFMERPYDPDRKSRRPGQWWWSYECTCPAADQGYKICWHRAAVWAWCLCYHVFDPVVQAEKYQLALKRHMARLQRWAEVIAEGKVSLLYLPVLTANVPDPLTGELWVDADDLYPLGVETEVERDLRERGVPETSPEVDFDPGPGAIRAMIENTRRLVNGEELPR